MRRLLALTVLAGSIFVGGERASAHGCSAWTTGSRGTGYCSQNSGHSARLAVACRRNGALDYRYYYRWLSNGGVQVVWCLSGWYASSAFMQVR